MAKPIVHGVKERPILFSGPMVRALLDGSKTQTRRVMKAPWDVCNGDPIYRCGPDGHGFRADKLLPYGQPGDRLWVREAFAFTDTHAPEYDGSVDFRADGKCYAVSGNELVDVPSLLDPFRGPWRPSIHVPRWACRILLEIVSVRVERLQDISEVDALAEGISSVRTLDWDLAHFPEWRKSFDEACARGEKPPLGPLPSQSYCALWEQINGPGSWDANPFVWAIEFKRVAT